MLVEVCRSDVLKYKKNGKCKEGIKIEREAQNHEKTQQEQSKKVKDEGISRKLQEWLKKIILEKGGRRPNFAAQNQAFSTNRINKQASGEDVS